jgi:transcriptional regulator with XRE-family HTH domain
MTTTPLSDTLRAAVEQSGLTPYAVAQAAGVKVQVVSRWLKGERDLYLKTADRIAAGLGLQLPVGKLIPKKS